MVNPLIQARQERIEQLWWILSNEVGKERFLKKQRLDEVLAEFQFHTGVPYKKVWEYLKLLENLKAIQLEGFDLKLDKEFCITAISKIIRDKV